MADVEVAVTSDEIQAEIVRSKLESEGIAARVMHRSQVGLPAAWSPVGLGYGIQSFSVRVRPADAERACEIVGTRPEEPPIELPRSRLVSVIATVMLLWFLLGAALGLTQLLPQLGR